MRRIFLTGLAVLLLAGLLPGVGELVENVVHLATQGHLAHAEANGDTHGPLDAEHGCTGALHICSCCVSVSYLAGKVPTTGPGIPLPTSREPEGVRIGAFPPRGLDHPPKA